MSKLRSTLPRLRADSDNLRMLHMYPVVDVLFSPPDWKFQARCSISVGQRCMKQWKSLYRYNKTISRLSLSEPYGESMVLWASGKKRFPVGSKASDDLIDRKPTPFGL